MVHHAAADGGMGASYGQHGAAARDLAARNNMDMDMVQHARSRWAVEMAVAQWRQREQRRRGEERRGEGRGGGERRG
jgi:hypothetical protein